MTSWIVAVVSILCCNVGFSRRAAVGLRNTGLVEGPVYVGGLADYAIGGIDAEVAERQAFQAPRSWRLDGGGGHCIHEALGVRGLEEGVTGAGVVDGGVVEAILAVDTVREVVGGAGVAVVDTAHELAGDLIFHHACDYGVARLQDAGNQILGLVALREVVVCETVCWLALGALLVVVMTELAVGNLTGIALVVGAGIVVGHIA